MNDFTLRVFKEVAKKRSFSKAAKSIYLSQPAVSRQIMTLEEEFGASLFKRTRDGVILTKAGEVLLKHIDIILSAYKEAKMEIASLSTKERFIIGASTTLGEYILPKMINDFKNMHPESSLFLIVGNAEITLLRLKDGEINLALLEIDYKKPGWITEKFLVDELVLIVQKDSPLSKQKGLSLQALRKQPFIIREQGSGTRRILAEKLCELDMELACLNIALEVDSTDAVKNAVKQGIGVSLISKMALRPNEGLATLSIENIDLSYSFYLIYPQRNNSPILKNLLVFLKEQTHKL